jgi:ATP-dependent Zn protease
MDEYIIIAAHHEAGHALMAYIVGWTINSIKLHIKNDQLICAITNYNFGEDIINTETNLKRRLLCLLGGPISEAQFQRKNKLDIDALGHDGTTIDNLLHHLHRLDKENIIQDSINTTANFMKFTNNFNAKNQIVEVLLDQSNIDSDQFHQIMISNNITRMNFN